MTGCTPIAWSIAGTDPSAGAGIQADLKTFQGLGVYGCTVITAVIAQNTRGVDRIEPVPSDLVEQQAHALQCDVPPHVFKLGMLGARDVIRVVARAIDRARVPVVADTVLKSTSGADLLPTDALQSYREEIVPRATILTPNLHEAQTLLGRAIRTDAEVETAARDLRALGARAVLVKGGHRDGPLASDFWCAATEEAWIHAPRLDVTHTHGGGCTLSSAIAAGLALDLSPLDAAILGRAYVQQGLRLGGGIGTGRGPLAHLGWPASPADLPWIAGRDGTLPPAFPDCGAEPLGLYPIVDRADWVERLIAQGVRTIQLRIKDLSGDALAREIERAIAAARAAGARLFINDHWQLAIRNRAYGVHIGQDDLPTTDLAALRAAGLRLGVSTHGLAEIARAVAVRPSYLAIGTVFQSPSKSFAHTPLGLDRFARLRRLIATPVVAIGGITLDRAPAVRAAGADGIAVISDIARASDLAARIAAWKTLFT